MVVDRASEAPALQLTPGTILGDRYRVVSMLGRGGMGAVYRADDLKLGQPVALKFLSGRGDAARLYDEVRIGRQVSHPNVCRLHDIAEVEGQLFITMEFVDGEDLASLLRRVGRLPHEKALAVARDICAGLAAAHEKNVIHRDLKPGNVMIDGRGRARITDFGLAVAEERRKESGVAGTPAYMAPEQLEGEPASQLSDIYAFGLILYEIFTGQRAFTATSTIDLVMRQRARDFSRPSSMVREIDPAIDRIIIHCLEADPELRPRSAEDILRALPGGDPLAAAIAAGETPSPAMVAAAAERGDLSARAAWSWLCVFLVALLLFGIASSRTMVHRVVAVKSPDVLEERARDVLAATHQPLHTVSSASFFYYDLVFFYRLSPEPMRAIGFDQRVVDDDPPMTKSGMASVRLGPTGPLRELVIVPPQLEAPPTTATSFDWTPLLTMAALEHLNPTMPRWAAPVDSDQKHAWVTPDGTRVEAASYHGKPVWFSVIAPTTKPDRMPGKGSSAIQVAQMAAAMIALSIVWFSAFFLAMRNLRRGQGDRRGASRLAWFIFPLCLATLTFRATITVGWQAFPIAGKINAYAALIAVATWFGYIAVEPLVRRSWPRMLIGWTRVLAGRFRDPMVGRDVLVGATTGALAALVWNLCALAPGASPNRIPPSALSAVPQLVYWLLRTALGASFLPLAALTFLLAIRVITRRLWPGLVLFVLFGIGISLQDMDAPLWVIALYCVIGGFLGLAVLFRFGVLAMAVSIFYAMSLQRIPTTFNPNAWYFGRSLFGLGVLVALALFGFIVSLGGKRWLPEIAVEPLQS